MELNTPVNPAGNMGADGIIVVGSRLVAKTDMLAVGQQPSYAHTGDTHYLYWIVANDSTRGTSLPLQAGYANTNGKGNITVSWPKINGEKISYDVLRTEGTAKARSAPYGKGDFAVATGVPQCVVEICHATHSQPPLTPSEVTT